MSTRFFAKTILAGAAFTWLAVFAGASGAQAAFEQKVELAYNTAVQGQDALDGLKVSVQEQTVSSLTNLMSDKTVDLAITGIREESLSASIKVTTDEGSQETYYEDGYYYEKAGDEQIRTEMDRETIWKKINSEIYLDMTSNYLRMLYATEEKDGSVTYSFAANQDSLADYKEKLLDAYSSEMGTVIDSLQGTMRVDKDGHVLSREISMVYAVGEEENMEVFHKTVSAVFKQEDEVDVDLPRLSGYEDADEEKPAVTITPLTRTVYVTADVNVRAAGSLEAAVIGGYTRGSGVSQTGYTSDGWIQVQYNGMTGFIWGEYVSETKPVYVTDSKGIMYATTDVNIRDTYSTDGKILDVLRKGQSIKVTGTTDNGWTRVDYNGSRGYISSNYLTRSEPVADTYVKNATVGGIVTDVSYGTLTVSTDSMGTLLFNTQYAAMNVADSLQSGDWVSVTFTGSGSPYTATSVTDTTTHGGGGSGSQEMYTVDGVVTSVHGSHMEFAGSDGVFRSFDLSRASVEVDGGLKAGSYVLVSWRSYTGTETDDIVAAAVS